MGCIPFGKVRIPLGEPAGAPVDVSRITLEDLRPPEALVRLTAFDTIEHCSSRDTVPSGGVTGVLLNPALGKGSGVMQVQLEGEINGNPFSVIRNFSHAGLDRSTAAVNRNPMFRDRLNGLLAHCADVIVAAASAARTSR